MRHGRAADHAAALLAAKDFDAARVAYESLLERDQDPELLAGLGVACRGLGDINGSVTAYERAYRLRVEAGDHAESGIIACALADIELTDLGRSAVGAGWLGRARHHLGAEPDHPGHVLLTSLSAYRALAYEKDPDTAEEFARESVEYARRLGDPAAEILGNAFLGLTEVTRGHLDDGFELLDDATAAAMAGEVPPLADLDVYCLLITACARVRDLDRADQWSQRVLGLSKGDDARAFAAFARTQYASLLIWRGRWPEADAELERVLSGAGEHPMTAAMAMVLRSSLRRRQGRLAESDAELAAAEREPYRRAVRHHVLAARAALELDRGNAQQAADLAERYLCSISDSDVIESVEALEVLVHARIALGDIAAAGRAVHDLDAAATAIPTAAIRASADACGGTVLWAQGRLEDARDRLQAAVAGLDDAGLPPDAVHAQIALGGVQLDLGDTAGARYSARSARDAAVELGADGEVAAADELLARTRSDVDATQEGLTSREIEVVRLMVDGLANAAIADALVLSPRTVERHISNIYLKIGATGPAARAVAIAYARRRRLDQ